MSLIPFRPRARPAGADKSVDSFCYACYAALGFLGLVWLTVMFIALG